MKKVKLTPAQFKAMTEAYNAKKEEREPVFYREQHNTVQALKRKGFIEESGAEIITEEGFQFMDLILCPPYEEEAEEVIAEPAAEEKSLSDCRIFRGTAKDASKFLKELAATPVATEAPKEDTEHVFKIKSTPTSIKVSKMQHKEETLFFLTFIDEQKGNFPSRRIKEELFTESLKYYRSLVKSGLAIEEGAVQKPFECESIKVGMCAESILSGFEYEVLSVEEDFVKLDELGEFSHDYIHTHFKLSEV